MISEERRYPPKLATPQPTSSTVLNLPSLFRLLFEKLSIWHCKVETGLLRKWLIHEMQANPDKKNISNNQHCQI
jgi:hypothetical protein